VPLFRGVPPFFLYLCLGDGSKAKNCPKTAFFLKKSLRRNAVNTGLFCFLWLVVMEDAIFEFVAIYGVLCMCVLKTL